MKIKLLEGDFAICKVKDFKEVNLSSDYIFIGKTKDENSILCEENEIPRNAIEIEKGWKGFVIDGKLDFSLVGIIAKISDILTKINVSIFVISTFDTDYIFIKKENLEKTIDELGNNGYEILGK